MTNNKEEEYYVGPYRLEKVLGRGQTGLVRLGIHCLTAKKVAVKIVNRERLSETVLQKVEREIAIMKLIEHPHVLALYDVYENKRFLYLVLEHVSGGELFDYLVRKGRLTPKEARRFFRQIISATDFCHNHLVCHRDLKPENLLLDEKGNIKVADFGMASLQPEGSLLETSCGSPHYACPEVIRGERYDGRKADIWSCGVILYALLVGCLPFDDDNLHNLLEKVKRGTFHLPSFLTSDACDIIRGMIEVNAEKRLTIAEIMQHPWMNQATSNSPAIELPFPQAVKTPLLSLEQIDSDVLTTMGSLQCFSDRSALVAELLSDKQNTEKVIYFLLLGRKLRRPANDDPDEVRRKAMRAIDPPKKRVDHWPVKPQGDAVLNFGNGSPLVRRKAKSAFDASRRNRSTSRSHALQFSPIDSPRGRGHLSMDESPQRSQISPRDRARQARGEQNNNGVVPKRNDNEHGVAAIDNRSSGNRATFARNRSHRAEDTLESDVAHHLAEKAYDPQAIPMIDDPQNEQNGGVVLLANNGDRVNNDGVKRPDQQSRWDNMKQDKDNENGTDLHKVQPQERDFPLDGIPDRVRMAGTPDTSPRHTASIMQWRARLSNIKNSIMGTPRFHRRSRIPMTDMQQCEADSVLRDQHRPSSDADRTYHNNSYSAIEPVRRSWFPLLKNDDHHIVVIKDRPLTRVKADLVQAFLATTDLVHTPISANTFRAEYRRFAGSSILSRSVKFQVDIINAHSDSAPQRELYCLDFWLVSGSYRRFKRIVDAIQSFLLPASVASPAAIRPQSPGSPAMHSPAVQRHYAPPLASTRPGRRLFFRPGTGYGNESAPESRIPGTSNYRAAATSLSATASEDDDESECGASSTASGPTQTQRNNYRANMLHRRRAQYSGATSNNMEVLKVYGTPTFSRKKM